ncbi:MAG: MmgE/PrpD family protein [Solirubrobacteraceae bacterium]
MTPLYDLARRFRATRGAADAVDARIVDTLGAYRAGAATAEGRAVAASIGAWDDGTLGAVAQRVAIVRLTELDDIHRASCTTPGSVVVPTAVTLAAILGCDGHRLREAVTVGYEAMVRLGSAIDGARAVYRGLWPTYFCAPFAAAAVVATLLDLDAARTVNALGIALTRATGLTSSVVGTPLARWLTLGDAARAGCAAALAARDGFVAHVDLERIATAAGVDIDAPLLLADAPAAIEEVSVKPFPLAKQSIAAVEAALRLRDRAGPGPVSVHVPRAYAAMIGVAPHADSRLSRMASARWNVALALLCPDDLHDVERLRSVEDPLLAPLTEAVEVLADAELSTLYPARWPARVEVSGLSETVLEAPGDPAVGNGPAAVEAKWRGRGERVDHERDAAREADPRRLDHLLRVVPALKRRGAGDGP